MTQDALRAKVAHAIENAVAWHLCEADGLYYAQLDPDDGSHSMVGFTSADLKSYDARVYNALLSLRSNYVVPSAVVASCLRRTVRHWDTPYLACTDVSTGVNFGYLGTFSRLRPSDTAGYILATVWCFDIRTVAHGVTVALEQRHRTVNIPEQWLEQHYPGSLHRFLVAHSLGLPDADIVLHAFNPSVATAYEAAALPPMVLGQ